MPTVRISDDVNDALKAMAKADPDGRSVTQLVDEVLRHRAGLSTTEPPGRARGRATMSRPRARGAARQPRIQTPAAKCLHPIGRRIGDMCAACGSSVR